ncbi:hypothetical protein M409DRAFT_50769 [Zasmidium cellare ATCC 36951]|uniref:Uncharacterized protein n=1 Tax=Zasmidium cellare ATCC 36951 TaxID=1080233 RepID=A0A6A6CW23_ZASCE|nr:uncharacterized protein M409DRAFT_50769 [Zasmidium cellare ATCC 36951]KAF2171311.1 hypothetical protein M409DRAFT_50769 [Zasmidium cellare ATCC 36951]
MLIELFVDFSIAKPKDLARQHPFFWAEKRKVRLSSKRKLYLHRSLLAFILEISNHLKTPSPRHKLWVVRDIETRKYADIRIIVSTSIQNVSKLIMNNGTGGRGGSGGGGRGPPRSQKCHKCGYSACRRAAELDINRLLLEEEEARPPLLRVWWRWPLSIEVSLEGQAAKIRNDEHKAAKQQKSPPGDVDMPDAGSKNAGAPPPSGPPPAAPSAEQFAALMAQVLQQQQEIAALRQQLPQQQQPPPNGEDG